MTITTENKYVYFLGNTMYINVTNLCTNNCVFCIRDLNETVAGSNLSLEENKVAAKNIIEEIKKNSPETRDEIVFCGYGEPLIKIDIVKEVATFIKENYKDKTVRVNTNGHASLIHKRNVVAELVGLIDKASVSLNAHNSEEYEKITKCKFDKEIAFEAVKAFLADCKKYGIDATASIVEGFEDYSVNVEECENIAKNLGVSFKIRKWLNEGYK